VFQLSSVSWCTCESHLRKFSCKSYLRKWLSQETFRCVIGLTATEASRHTWIFLRVSEVTWSWVFLCGWANPHSLTDCRSLTVSGVVHHGSTWHWWLYNHHQSSNSSHHTPQSSIRMSHGCLAWPNASAISVRIKFWIKHESIKSNQTVQVTDYTMVTWPTKFVYNVLTVLWELCGVNEFHKDWRMTRS